VDLAFSQDHDFTGLYIAAYTFSYHMNGGCALEKEAFWGNSHVRETLLKYRFEEHSFLWTQPGSKTVYPDPWKHLCLTLKMVVVVYVW